MAAKSNLTNMVLVLGATCLFCSAILGGAYALTKEPIEAAAAEKTNRAIAQVLPAFETAGERQFVEALGKDFPYYEAKNGEAPDRVVYNTSVLAHSETPGLGAKCTSDAKFVSQWKGFDPSVKKLIVKKDGGDVDAITASTITSRAYAQAVENALVAFDMLQAPDATSGATKPVEEGGQSNE